MRSQIYVSMRRAALFALLLCASDAWAISVSPSPSYSGSYTVSWSTTLGYSWVDEYPCYPEYYYTLYEDGVPVATSGYSLPVSGKPPGSYTYYVYFESYVCGFPYDGYIVEGPVTVDVLPPPPSFAVSDAASTPEGNQMAFVVTRSGTSTGSYTINYNTSFGTATMDDYTVIWGDTLTFASGEMSKTIYIQTTHDAIFETDETILMNLSSPSGGATITDNFAWGYIANNDPAPTFSISDVTVSEQNFMNFVVTKNGAAAMDFYINWSTQTGTAGTSDFSGGYGTLTFTPSDSSKAILLTSTQDSIYENTERFYVNLTSGATFSDNQGYGDITNDDPPPSFTINDVSVTEGGTLAFTVTKNGLTEVTHNVNYGTATGTAGSGDFTGTSNTLSFASGEPTKTVNVSTTQDSIYETAERLYVNLSSATNNATIADSQGYGDIANDDAGPSFTINDVTVGEGGNLSFTVTKNGASEVSHNVSYASANGSATAGSDYTGVSGTQTLTFTAAQATQNVTLPTFTDVWQEGNETLNVNLSAATSGATIGDSQGIGTIDDANDDTSTGVAAIWPVPNSTGYLPGLTSGSLTVDVTGNASYELPIEVPPGTAGMQPQLTVAYSSANGNGLLGVGWTITGLSAITRCPRTAAQDGGVAYIDGIDYDSGDRFCLDGQRLMAVPDLNGVTGAYGANGTWYRTELDQFAKIVSFGASGSGPLNFQVWTKAGRILEYGNTPDSRIEVASGETTVRVWAVNKVSDIVGNFMTVTYSDQSSQTDFQPELIAYTMNTNPGANLPNPFAAVDFVYESRTDTGATKPLYQGGWSATNGTNRLASIKTYNGGTPGSGGALIRSYNLAYAYNGSGQRSRLTSVTECSASGSCLPPTSFSWLGSGSAPALGATPVTFVTGGANPKMPVLGDWNGDGRTDVLMQGGSNENSQVYVADANGNQVATGSAISGWSMVEGWNLNQMFTGDFNGDGLTDVARMLQIYTGSVDLFGVIYQTHDIDLYIYRTEVAPNGTVTLVQVGAPIAIAGNVYGSVGPSFLRAGDYDGDGRTDFRVQLDDDVNPPGPISILFSTGTGFTVENTSVSPTAYTVNGDFNGDGRTDFVTPVSGNWQVYFATGSSFAAAASALTGPSGTFTPGIADFNGDGLDDLFLQNQTTSSTSYAYLSKGNGQFVSAWSGTGIASMYLGDWNNDGLADIAHHNTAGSSMLFDISTGVSGALFTNMTSKSWPSSTLYSMYSGDWNGDGLTDLLHMKSGNPYVYDAYVSTGGSLDLLNTVTDGLGAVSTIAYSPMTDDGGATPFYVKGALDTYPVIRVQNSRRLVKSITVNDGASAGNGTRAMSYRYERALTHALRRGGLGFEKITVTDERTGIVDVTTNYQTFPFVGLPLSFERRAGAVVVERNDYEMGGGTPSAAGVYFPFVQTHTKKSHELNSALVAKTVTTSVYDAFGNPTDVTTELFETDTQPTGEFKMTVLRSFHNDTTNWFIGQLVCQRTRDNPATLTRTVGFDYYTTGASKGLLKTEAIEPDAGTIVEPSTTPAFPVCETSSTDKNITAYTTYEYDAFGNRTSATVDDLPTPPVGEAPAQPARQTLIEYGEINAANAFTAYNGRFPVRIRNPKLHEWFQQYDGRFGALTRVRDPNLLTTNWTYDDLGRPLSELRPDGGQTQIYRAWCTAGSCPVDGKLKSVTLTDGQPAVAEVSDVLGRLVSSSTIGFDGKVITSTTTFNNKGQLYRTSRPYRFDTAAGQIVWTELAYDALGRPTSESAPGEFGTLTTTTEYRSGVVDQYAAEVVTTNPKMQVQKQRFNVRGDLVRAIDAAGTTEESNTTYLYDVFGNVTNTQVNDNAATAIVNTYDIRGRKLSTHDPDLSPVAVATWSYKYYALGELWKQTDAKGQATTYVYDVLGRTTDRAELEGTTLWTWDTSPDNKGKGKLYTVASPEGETRTFGYDSLSRVATANTSITGAGAGSFLIQQEFDGIGRLSKITYPPSPSSGYTNGLRVRYDYNTNGYLSEVRNDTAGAGNALIWKLEEVTADGQLKKALYGNGLTTTYAYQAQTSRIDSIQTGPSGTATVQNFQYDFDQIGNLTMRKDAAQTPNVSEQITGYDPLNRVTSVQRYSGTTAQGPPSTFAYYNNGDLGGQPNALGNLKSKTGVDGIYDYTVAVSGCPTGSVAPGPHAVRRTGSGGTARDFCYDANGNQLKGWNYERARERLIAWKSYNLPATISEGTSAVSFSYGADRQRFRQENGFANQTTIYVGGLYEKEITGTFAKHVNYIFAGGHAVAVLNSATDNSTAMQYLHRDHLGSVTHLTDQSGNVVESLSYDIWGKRRQSNWADAPSPLPPTLSQRGFTGHEGLDDVNVVHMNGRVYDASLGKMLSADPYVQFPDHSQSFNRYSYVLNNPGSYTDPSGFCIAGFACPTSGLAGFTGGRAGSLNRAGLARASVTVVTSAFRSFSGGGFSFSRQWGGGLGHASCIVDSGSCGSPYILNFRSWSRGDVFGSWWSMFAAWVSTVSSQQTYVYVNASVDRPDGQGGSDALHALALNERNFTGLTISPVLSLVGNSNQFCYPATGAMYAPEFSVTGAINDAYGAVIDADIPFFSRLFEIGDAASAPFVELFTGYNVGLYTGRVPTAEAEYTASVVTFAAGAFGALEGAVVSKVAPHGNSLLSAGAHDVYVIRDAVTGRIYHFGQTGRGYLVRGREWIRKLKNEHGLTAIVQRLRTVQGKPAARELETRYIDTYEKIYGFKPGYVDSSGDFVPLQKSRH